MSVYIRGMEMPPSCCACNLCTKYLFETPPFCDVTMKRIKDWSKRSDDCPVIPVPDHGRLIDADKLMDALPDDFSIPSTAAKVIEKTIIPTSKEDG